LNVSDGLFTTQLDFGAGLLPYVESQALWLQIDVNGTPLTSRQPLTTVPTAQHATSASQAPGRFDITGPTGSLNFGTGPIGIAPAVSGIIIHLSDLYVGEPSLRAAKKLRFGIPPDPCVGLDPAVGPGLLLDADEVYLGGPDTVTPQLHFGGAADPS